MTVDKKLRRVAEVTGTNLNGTPGCSGRYLLENMSSSIDVNPLFMNALEMKDIHDAQVKPVLSRIFKDYEHMRPETLDSYKESDGTYIHIKKNAKITLPLETCYFLTKKGGQVAENVIHVDDGAEVNIVTSCAKAPGIGNTRHVGSTYVLVGRNASLTHTMLHHWDSHSSAKPLGVVRLEDDSRYVNNYVSLNPVKSIQSDPLIICSGKNSKAVTNTVLYVSGGSTMDIGGTAHLNGMGSGVEMNTRAVCLENSSLIARGYIAGNNSKCKGHLECRGLVLDSSSVLEAIPILRATKPGPELTHEAGIGGLSQREISYLMSRRMTEDEAVGALIRGFMDLEMEGLPAEIEKQINYLSELTAEAS